MTKSHETGAQSKRNASHSEGNRLRELNVFDTSLCRKGLGATEKEELVPYRFHKAPLQPNQLSSTYRGEPASIPSYEDPPPLPVSKMPKFYAGQPERKRLGDSAGFQAKTKIKPPLPIQTSKTALPETAQLYEYQGYKFANQTALYLLICSFDTY